MEPAPMIDDDLNAIISELNASGGAPRSGEAATTSSRCSRR